MTTQLTVLDVGHGNCSVLIDNGLVGVIDAGRGPYATFYLSSMGIEEIDLIVISHTDDDHLAGIIGILSSEKIKVKTVALNADSIKDTKIWRDVKAALASKYNEGKINLALGVFRGTINQWGGSDITLEVISPSAFNALSGVGGKDQDGKKITANSGSIVIRTVHKKSGSKVLLGADMEEQTLNELIASEQDISASTLIFPHHGGKPGSNDVAKFTAHLLDAVKPSFVLFSNGRGKYNAPRPEIIASVCAMDSYIGCTQISTNCHPNVLKQNWDNLPFSAGSNEGHSCAGTMVIDLETGRLQPDRMAVHIDFIAKLDSPMCKQKLQKAPLNESIH